MAEKQSVFKNEVKTYESDITGENIKYKVNNYLWIVLQEQFNLTQIEFDKQVSENPDLTMTKFVTAVMLANGLDVTFEEVAKNTTQHEIAKFYNGFFDVAFPEAAEVAAKLAEAKVEDFLNQ